MLASRTYGKVGSIIIDLFDVKFYDRSEIFQTRSIPILKFLCHQQETPSAGQVKFQ